MHLLAATPGLIESGKDPVDLGQTPADLVVISAVDTELAALAKARAVMDAPPLLRLVNMQHLIQPLSVDLHLDDCATQSRLVIARVLGGIDNWRHGVAQYAARLHAAGVPLALLPGDDKPDGKLRELSTVAPADYDALWRYLVEGGPGNATNFLHYASAILDGTDKPATAAPLLRAGAYWPGTGVVDLAMAQAAWARDAPIVPVIFSRALVTSGGLAPIDFLVKSSLRNGLNPLPIFIASLKDPVSVATLDCLFTAAPPAVILDCTAFAVDSPQDGNDRPADRFLANDAPVFQVVLSDDTAMNLTVPEVDRRIMSRAISFNAKAVYDDATQCPIVTNQARGDRIDFIAALAANWAKLRQTAAKDRRVALVLAGDPIHEGRLAKGFGLDTPAATFHVLRLLAEAGYRLYDAPADAQMLMNRLLAGPTNRLSNRARKAGGVDLSMADYQIAYGQLPNDVRTQIEDRWGPPEADPFFAQGEVDCGRFKLPILQFGNVCVGLQPAWRDSIDPTDPHHSPDLVPPHNYLAFYVWLRHEFRTNAIVQMGGHGNLEWLPGKTLALSETCWPEVALGPTPHIYPFIVNDPGAETQARRRTSAVIIDYLTPPLTRAETYGPLRDLEALIDEYYQAAGGDPHRVAGLQAEIESLARATGLDVDAGMQGADDLGRLDAYLCELKEAQIRDGLHVFGVSPTEVQERDLAIALARMPRGDGKGGDASLLRALADDLGLGFDPLGVDLAAVWDGPRPDVLTGEGAWRTAGDTVERLELLCQRLLDGDKTHAPPGPASASVMDQITRHIRPTVADCGPAEGAALLAALDGRFVPPGPSGAPTRGRMDVLPTGRDFYPVDNRAVPTPTAWLLGWKSANLLFKKHRQYHGDWPRTMLMTATATANMRTGGDDIAQALALMGVKPQWDSANRCVTGFTILPQDVLERPRVDVTLRISGLFRDAFPHLIYLLDSAARAVQALDEAADQNPAAALARAGEHAARVFGPQPGVYGTGLQALIDGRIWADRVDLGAAYIESGCYVYGAEMVRDPKGFEQRLRQVDAIVQNQDNREHDLLDSADYYPFQGGAAAAVAMLQGHDRPIYHNDHSRPDRPAIRTLDDEIGRVVRSRVVNPKWIAGVMRHGYKGASEIATTVDCLFAFAATTGAVKNHHFDLVAAAFLADEAVRNFIARHNAPALTEIAARLQQAIDRGLWQPRSDSVVTRIATLAAGQW